jgi:predicted RNA-binding Zn ribbon-like protein
MRRSLSDSAADNLLHFAFLSLFSTLSFQDLGDPGKYDKGILLGVFPPEAVEALDANPAASNLLLKKGAEVVVRTPGELRALAATLEEVVRLTRPRLAESLAKGKHLEANLRLMSEGLSGGEVGLAAGEAEAAGYPEGTRLFRVFAPNGYSLLLVRQGGAMKIVHAGLPHD